MYSLSFPDMFTSSATKLVQDHEATMSNLKLLLLSDTNSLFGDPYFGTPLKRFLYAQNGTVIQDLVVDSIYTSVLTFMPQVSLNRNNIELLQDKTQLSAKLKAVNLLDNTPDLYNILLTDTTTQ